MAGNPSFGDVKQRLMAGTESAAELVAGRHFERIVRLVHHRIGQRFRNKIDAEDIANSTLKSFFNRYDGDGLSDWDALMNLLDTIAMNKLRNRIRDFRRQKRDVAREVSGEALGLERGVDDLVGNRAGDGPSDGPPDEAVVIHDLCEHLMDGFTDEKRRMIELSLEGYSVEEISAAVGFSERTVIRTRDQFKRRIEELRDTDDE